MIFRNPGITSKSALDKLYKGITTQKEIYDQLGVNTRMDGIVYARRIS